VNAVCGSIFLLVNELHKGLAGSGGDMTFLVGGLQSNLTTAQSASAATIASIGFIILLGFAGNLNAASLSDEEALSLGVRIHVLRWSALIIASLMTAAAVAVSGPIGFVGLVAPHIARLVVGVDQRRLLPLATAFGAALLCLADAASRVLAHGSLVAQSLPVGVLTGLLGGPFFLLLLWQYRRRT
jgi:iron complex transport system permease protein